MNLAILGPGLLGGSIALAGKAAGHRLSLWARRPESVAEVQELHLADRVSTDLEEMVADADLVVLCVPIGVMPAIAARLVNVLRATAVVTDVGSVKAPVCAALRQIFAERGRFVGSHPMAGSDQHGLAAARADLFAGAVSIVTPDGGSDPQAVAMVAAFWSELGCRVLELSPEEHDVIVALVSHFPHLLAATLINTVAAENARAFEFCGPGFRDTTRVAGGLPEMWTEILATNRVAVRQVAEAMIEKLQGIITLLDCDQSMTDFLTQAKVQRDRLRRPLPPHV